MHAPIFIPPPINETKKCDRCGMQYPIENENCSHCTELKDEEVENLKLEKMQEHKGNANLGNLFIYAAILISILMVALSNT